MAELFINPVSPVLDANANPLSGAKATFYQTGTLILVDTYQDSGLTTPNTNPVVADSAGRFGPVYLDGGVVYRVKITTAAGVLIDDIDPYSSGLVGSLGAVITNALGSGHAALLVEQYNITAGDYAIESHVYPGAQGNVFHHYSDATTALKIDNVGNQAVLTLNNTENSAVRPGVHGNGVLLTLGGYFNTTGAWGTANTHGIIGILGPTLQFASYDAGMQFNFTTGLLATAGVSEVNRAFAITALNPGYAQTISGTDSGLFISTSANSGIALAVAKGGTGAGVLALFANSGTGNIVEFANGVSSLTFIDKDGHLGIGVAPGAYGLQVTTANATQTYIKSTGANDMVAVLDNAAGGREVSLKFSDAGVVQGRLYKTTANSIILEVASVALLTANTTGGVILGAAGQEVGFYGTTPIAKPTVTGSRGANAALASALTQLANLGLITDSSS